MKFRRASFGQDLSQGPNSIPGHTVGSSQLSTTHLLFHVPHFSASFFAISSAGFVDFPSVADPLVLVRVWLESMTLCVFLLTPFWAKFTDGCTPRVAIFFTKTTTKAKNIFQWAMASTLVLLTMSLALTLAFQCFLLWRPSLATSPKFTTSQWCCGLFLPFKITQWIHTPPISSTPF